MTALEEWLDGVAVEDMLNVSTRTLQKYRSSGRLPFLKIGNKIFYKRTDVEAYLDTLYDEQNAPKRAAHADACNHPVAAHADAYIKKGEAYE